MFCITFVLVCDWMRGSDYLWRCCAFIELNHLYYMFLCNTCIGLAACKPFKKLASSSIVQHQLTPSYWLVAPTGYHLFRVVVAHRDCRCGHLAEYNCGRSETSRRTRNRARAVRSHISWLLPATPMDPARLAGSVASGARAVERTTRTASTQTADSTKMK